MKSVERHTAFHLRYKREHQYIAMAVYWSHEPNILNKYDDVIKWKHFPPYWPFVQGTHRGPGNVPYKGQWRGALMFSLICVCINGWVNTREAGDLSGYRDHYDVIVKVNKTNVDPLQNIVVLCVYKYVNCLLYAKDRNELKLPVHSVKCIMVSHLWIHKKMKKYIHLTN